MNCDLSKQRVLIIGGGGFIGRHVVSAFRAAGASVSVLDAAPAPLMTEGLDWITGSIADSSLVASAALDCRTVIFLASSSLPGSSHADLAGEIDAHVHVAVKVAEICETMKVHRFLFASSGGTVYGVEPEGHTGLHEQMPTQPRNAYGASKLSIEHYLRLLGELRGMRTMSLRIANPYGEGQRAARSQGFVAAAMQHAIAGTIMPIWGDGSVERDFIHVTDVAHAFVMAAVHDEPPQVLNIGSGYGVSLREMLGRIEAALGRPVEVTHHPDRIIDVRRNILDIRSAREHLGWEPRIDLTEGLARTARWWLSGAGTMS